jgi:hypothetical protein
VSLESISIENKERQIFTCIIDVVSKLNNLTVITLLGYNENSFAVDSTNVKRIILGEEDLILFYSVLEFEWSKDRKRFAEFVWNEKVLRLTCNGEASDIYSNQEEWLEIIKLHI